MSVVFDIHDVDPCELYWTTANIVVGAGGQWALVFSAPFGGQWVAWSVTQSDSANAVVTISVAGDRIIDNFGARDGQIYSPANLPPLAPNQAVNVNGTGTGAASIFFNVLLRKTS